MKGHNILNLFYAMVTIIFIAGYFDQFKDMETFFVYLLLWIMIGFPTALFIGWLTGPNKDDKND